MTAKYQKAEKKAWKKKKHKKHRSVCKEGCTCEKCKKDRHKKHMWKKMDADEDGHVSRQEFIDAHERKFKKMDADSDGMISKAEKKSMEEKEASQKG